MEKIDRYKFFGGGDEVTSPEGDWIRYEDHERVVKLLENEIALMRAAFIKKK